MNSKKNMCRRDYLLQGKATCGCCGYALVYNNPTDLAKYRCIHTLADKNAECHKMGVNANELEEAVMTVIQKQAGTVLNSGDLLQMRKKDEAELLIAEYEKK